MPDTAFTLEPEDLATTIMTNVMGPALVSRYLLPAIERSDRKVIVNLTSTLASIGRDCGPGSTSYSISKTALNMLVRSGYCIVCVPYGWLGG